MFERWMLDLQLFAAEGGAGGGDSNAESDGGDGKGDGDGGQTAGGGRIEFTPEQQAHVDALIAQRLARANKTAGKAALEARAKELGFESVEAMDAALEAHKKAQDAHKTEAEKLREQLEAEKAKAAGAAEQAKRALIKAAFTAEAVGANLVNVDDAFVLADLSDVTVDDNGNVTGVKEAVEALVKDKPYLVKQDGGSGGSGPGGFREGGSRTANTAIEQARRILERQGLVQPTQRQTTEQPKSNYFFGG